MLQVLEGFDDYPNIAAMLSRRGFLQWTSIGTTNAGTLQQGRYDAAAQSLEVGYAAAAQATMAANFSEVFIGFGALVVGNPTVTLYDTVSASAQIILQFNSDGSISYPGGRTVPNTCPQGTWFFFEIGAQISRSSGTLQCKVNNQIVVNSTGINTSPGATPSVNAIQFGNNVNNESLTIDDLYVCDATGSAPFNTFQGDKRIITLSVTAAGDSAQWTPNQSGQPNYAMVATDDGDTSYNASSTAGQLDLFHLGSLPADVSQVLAVQVTGVYRKSDASTHTVQQYIKSGGTLAAGSGFLSPYAQTNNYLFYSDTPVVNDPATGQPWALEALASGAIQIGYELAS